MIQFLIEVVDIEMTALRLTSHSLKIQSVTVKYLRLTAISRFLFCKVIDSRIN